MAVTDNSDRLGCGRDLDEVWARADSPPDTHELTCPECQQARAGYAELSTLTHELRSRDESDPTLRLGLDVLTNITSIARAEVRRGQQIPLRRPAPGSEDADLTVTEQAVATLVRRIGDDHPGIEIRRCRVRPVPDDTSEPSTSAGELTEPTELPETPVPVLVDITASVSARVPIAVQVSVLRDQIIAAIADEIGILAHTVNIHVEDVHDA